MSTMTLELAGQSSASASRDPLMEHFVRGLLPSDEADQVMRGFYTDALRATLIARLADLRDVGSFGQSSKVKPLPNWRLKRVCEFVDTNLEGRILLWQLAQAAGISRMYFAAQFRAATGVRPHDYLIGRRIARAKEMLARPVNSIVDVALSVGFQTQAHFTTVFKRREGLTPHKWREHAHGYHLPAA